MKDSKKVTRRFFARSMAVAGLASASLPILALNGKADESKSENSKNERLKLSLNAYSFDKPLKAGTMTISEMFEFCAKTGFDGVDLTGYYLPGYPAVPSDELIYRLKRKAFSLGLEICSTGVRNDFTWSDPDKRAEEKKLVKDWIIVAEKFGASFIRVFTGTLSKEDYTWEQKLKWIAEDINECAEFGKNHGVVIAIQNHNDYLKNASEVDKLMKLVDSEWVGLMLDIGSYHSPDPYSEIEQNSKYAISWQLKEKVFINESQADTDYSKIIAIVRKSGFQGYLPIETLGAGDPAAKVEALYNKVITVLRT